eukprot:TRINITY_DN7879_c1_g1_i4.p1 TRINITY_DN7879_c1_g1~~TRINITY_DN7879_c1_g1_i4.p1  ORF type:complete len:184 (+),score=67.70 TRINITY_DN7879_c1_g1_i4:136-687(+)
MSRSCRAGAQQAPEPPVMVELPKYPPMLKKPGPLPKDEEIDALLEQRRRMMVAYEHLPYRLVTKKEEKDIARYSDRRAYAQKRKEAAVSKAIWDQDWGLPSELLPKRARRASTKKKGSVKDKIERLAKDGDDDDDDDDDEAGDPLAELEEEEEVEEGGDYLIDYYENDDDTFEPQENDVEETF